MAEPRPGKAPESGDKANQAGAAASEASAESDVAGLSGASAALISGYLSGMICAERSRRGSKISPAPIALRAVRAAMPAGSDGAARPSGSPASRKRDDGDGAVVCRGLPAPQRCGVAKCCRDRLTADVVRWWLLTKWRRLLWGGGGRVVWQQ